LRLEVYATGRDAARRPLAGRSTGCQPVTAEPAVDRPAGSRRALGGIDL